MSVKSVFPAVFAAAVLLVSCSTTRLLEDGQYRLAKNNVKVVNDNHFNANEISPYIKQRPGNSVIFGWNPFMNVYNWSGRDTSRFMNKTLRKIGEAPVVYEPDLVEESADNIKNHLEYLGYYNSSVDSRVSVKKRRITVDYFVTLGKRFRIRKLDYSVPSGGTFAEDFYRDTSNVTVKVGDYLSEAALEAESARSAEHMRNQGYYGFSKSYYFFEADTLIHPGSADLEMSVREYTRNESPSNARPLSRYNIGNVSISYPRTLKFNEKVLRHMNTLVPGEPYSEDIIQRTYDRFSSLKTFSGVNMEMTRRDSNLVDCSINLSQASLMGFKTGLEASSNSSGLIGVSPQLSFYNRNIFHGGEWLSLNFMGNFQFKTSENIRSNEFGVSSTLSIPRLLLLPDRWFSHSRNIPRTEIKFSYNYQDRPEYFRNILSASFGYSGVFRRLLSYQIYPLQLSGVHLYNLDPDFYERLANNPFMRNAYQNHFDWGSGFMLLYSTNTDLTPKSSYHYARLQFDVAGNVLSAFNGIIKRNSDGTHSIWGTPYSQYVRVELQIGKTWTFGANDAFGLATRILGGIGHAYGNSTALPFEKQFYSGGASSLRGWPARGVGPGLSELDNTFIIPSQTGNIKLETNVEFRFPLFWKLAAAIFADAGNVWLTQINFDNADDEDNAYGKISPDAILTMHNFGKSIAADWGMGVRLNLGFILLRLDYGLQFHDPAIQGNKWIGPDRWFKRGNNALQFGVGYPF
ncbi:MAG: BamA/TamA family outer membrane protein [Bacteroidales bacterium]|nr:BamA/TamA family outer membrane protein [Bacteroidales bacterium]